MTWVPLDLVGQTAVAADGLYIGKIREVVAATSSQRAYLIITYSLFYDAIVPTDEVARLENSIQIPWPRSALLLVLRDAADHQSVEGQHRVDRHYRFRLPTRG